MHKAVPQPSICTLCFFCPKHPLHYFSSYLIHSPFITIIFFTIEAKFMYHKTNHVKANNSVAGRTFAMLYS